MVPRTHIGFQQGGEQLTAQPGGGHNSGSLQVQFADDERLAEKPPDDDVSSPSGEDSSGTSSDPDTSDSESRASSEEDDDQGQHGTDVAESKDDPEGRTTKKRGPKKRKADEHSGDTRQKKRGRPSLQISKEKEKEDEKGEKKGKKRRERTKVVTIASNTLSVRSIPCFFKNCTYSYKRPGSSIVEISDRPLLLPKKFDGFTIRSCKKHHDKWKARDRSGTHCEVCRGLNAERAETFYNYVNLKNQTFVLCAYCAEKQGLMLQLLDNRNPVGKSSSEMYSVSGSEKEEEESMDIDDNRVEESTEGIEPLEEKKQPTGQEESKEEEQKPKMPHKYVLYRRSPPDWSLVKDVAYQSQLSWGESLDHLKVQEVKDILKEDQENPFPLLLKKVEDEVLLFAGELIPADVCIGEFTGKVVKTGQAQNTSFCCPFVGDTVIDATEAGNEFRFIKSSTFTRKKPNVRIVVADGRALVVTTKKIKKHEQIIGDFVIHRSKESRYLAVFDKIYQFNKENLTEEELKSSAFQWFLNEGHKGLKSRGKITVPIEHRIPAKKNIASNYNVKKVGKFTKNALEWGYVAQLEELDLERAREDCWVTFKASPRWDHDAFLKALSTWRRTRNISMPKPTSEIRVVDAIQRAPSPVFKKDQVPEAYKIRKSASFSPHTYSRMTGLRELEEIPYSNLSIKQDSSLSVGSHGYANVFRAYWKGYPVAVRFPGVHVPSSEDERRKFIRSCSTSALVHPNIVTSYACCLKENMCLVMEYMNLGNLEQWLISTQRDVQAMYIPRIALDIARAVEYIHSKGTIHGNLKSTNILMKGEKLEQGLIANLEVKVGDLGIGLHLDKHTQRNLAFVAPEVLAGGPPTQATDVYGFGMILCHLFSEGTKDPKPAEEVIVTSNYLQLWDPKWKELILNCTSKDALKRHTFSQIMDIVQALAVSSKVM